MKRMRICIAGIVQGVGFRPFVYRLARWYELTGWVLNDAAGVVIEAEGDPAGLAAFVAALENEAPAAAVISAVTVTPLPLSGDREFVIRPSRGSAAPATLISPDVATCPDCRRELVDPRDRRFGYPFINCTNCGPRYTIIAGVPYDRPRTTMNEFAMCPVCQAEYDDPANRRFHAQPNACPVCGPVYRLLDRDGRPVAGEPLAEARRLVDDGAVLAVKGLGGYHLACDATSEQAVAILRAPQGSRGQALRGDVRQPGHGKAAVPGVGGGRRTAGRNGPADCAAGQRAGLLAGGGGGAGQPVSRGAAALCSGPLAAAGL